jgi:hypothetical protein
MQEIATKRPSGGIIKIVGKAHGALNCILVPADNPDNWGFKQFVTEEEFDEFVVKYNLTVQRMQDEEL